MDKITSTVPYVKIIVLKLYLFFVPIVSLPNVPYIKTELDLN